MRVSSTEINFNDYTNNGYYCLQRSTNYTNSPTNSFAGMLYIFNANDPDMSGVMQKAHNVDTGETYQRFKWAGIWQSWVKIQTVSV